MHGPTCNFSHGGPLVQEGRQATHVDRLWILFWIISAAVTIVRPEVDLVRIGGIFDSPGEVSAFRLAVEFVNERELLGEGIRLDYLANTTGVISGFESIQIACHHASQGVTAFVGPMSSTPVAAVAPLSQAFAVPQFAPAATNPHLGRKTAYPFLIRMTPPDSMQSRALISLVEYFGWTKFAILTSNTEYGVNGLASFQSEAARRGWRVLSVQQFHVTNTPHQTDARRQLSVIKNTGVRVVLLNALDVFGIRVLEQAARMEMTEPGWAWVVTDGITGTNSIPSRSVPEYLRGLIGTKPSFSLGKLGKILNKRWLDADPADYPGTEVDLYLYASNIMDAVLAFAYAARAMYEEPRFQGVTQQPQNCMTPKEWTAGSALLDYIKTVKGDGLSADIEFNHEGAPLKPRYDIVNLQEDGWHTVGHWDPIKGLHEHTPKDHDVAFHGGQTAVNDYVSVLANRTLRIVVHPEEPFVMLTNTNYDANDLQPGDVEGLCIDLLNNIAETISFNYTMYLVPDGNFGKKHPDTYQWNGLVKELVDRNADMAVTSLTISFSREQDIDFTKPYLDLGMRFVMKRVIADEERPFKFMDPFNGEVWRLILVSSILVGVYVSLLNKLSPYDHHGEFIYTDYVEEEKVVRRNVLSCYKEYKRVKKIKLDRLATLSFANSLWFSLASLLQQGGEAYPKSPSARLATVLWLFAIVIVIATYTANLAAFLTASRRQTTIESIEDLGAQSKLRYGTVANSAPHQFFIDSNVTLYQDMLTYMNQQGSFFNSSQEAVEKARQGEYAFIWDSAVLDYVVEKRPCDTLQNVGRLFGKIGYGFGLQKSSPYKEEISYHILRLRETGYMEDITNKWYKENGECARTNGGQSEQEKAIEAAGGKLGVQHMLGVFIIIYVGIVLSLGVLVLEWIVACKKAVDKDDLYRPSSFCEAFCRRWLALVKDTKELCHFRLLRRGTNGELSKTAETSDIGEQTKPASVFQRVPRLSRPSIFSISVDSMASSCLSNDVDFQSDVRRKATLRSAAHNSQSRLQNGSVFSQPSLTRGRHLYRRRGQENAGFTIDPQDFTAPDTGWHSPVAVRTPHIGDNSLL